ncbi:DNA-directed RNA polymerase I subunit RPA12 [Glossina fuscipes]|uniref:DNA-directed RNA polymerase subunit n=1 Tax=Glossina fuscipes TaxID=7396 RepID=A0A8U0WKE0_9MUSC|nr:DNA-directed RNA polymerase I subunit RPA12 [Glossina fuscipes]
MESFATHPEFCPSCGTIFPHLDKKNDITCYNCKKVFPAEILGDQTVEYTLHFNYYDPEMLSRKKKQKEEDEPEGPIVERKCSKCGCETMTYATLQLRSADEGQTVFYTCTKCKSKEVENS